MNRSQKQKVGFNTSVEKLNDSLKNSHELNKLKSRIDLLEQNNADLKHQLKSTSIHRPSLNRTKENININRAS